MIKPAFDYLLCEKIEKVTGAVTTTDVSDTWQKFRVLAVGPGRPDEEGFIEEMPCEVGDIIWAIKYAEGDTPDELKTRNQFLIRATKIMAVETE